eukprot:CAMPEP_0170613126 /NCGR_PEP_ID=MMETSP0224-20130122/24104_1 /TAXON_ID=285029 /ORGANISM="Togula jolla, Strain CCCM 725" /LENGTH=320 /DNA_ID=CAMNT_0010938703 /DNA_START=75 /DNA_END=1037 /DNA_ORIENTATION=+
MSLVRCSVAFLLIQVSAALRTPLSDDYAQSSVCPSLFAAVFSARDNIERRGLIRQMWLDASEQYGEPVVGKFALCQAPEDEDPSLQKALDKEASSFKDLLFLNCEEGYLNGILTKKVLAAMHAYLMHYSDYEMFMKIDDDAFISLRRLCDLMTYRKSVGKSNDAVYMGVFAEIAAGEQMKNGNPVIRDPSSPWYEPESNYEGERFPVSAKGGPGYMLPRRLVRQIAVKHIGRDNVLNNEDKAVGVWVDKLLQEGETIEYVNLKGTDGYEEHKAFIPTTGKWSSYPFIVHHHLPAESIACLHEIEMKQDGSEEIDACFDDA